MKYRIRERWVNSYTGEPMFQLERQTWIGRWVSTGECGTKQRMLRALKIAQTPETIYGDSVDAAERKGEAA